MRRITLFFALLASVSTFAQSSEMLVEQYLAKGIARYEVKKYEEALQYFDKVVQMDAQNVKAYVYQAQCMAFTGFPEKALDRLNSMAGKHPKNASLRMTRGYIYAQLKEPWKAIKEFTRALEIDPTKGDYFYDRACAFSDVEIYDVAIINYTQAINLSDSVPDYFYNRALAYESSQQYQLAIADYSVAIKLNPTDPDAYIGRALNYMLVGKQEAKACEDLRVAAEELDYEQAKILYDVQCDQ